MSSAFEKAVRSVAPLAQAYRKGLQAIRNRDLQRITSRRQERLTGSVDLDAALRPSLPNANRWDYGIGVKGSSEHVVWVEVHPASSNHVQDVIDKASWLRGWLVKDAPSLAKLPRQLVWVASGTVALTAGSPQRRRLAQEGIHFAGRGVRVDEL